MRTQEDLDRMFDALDTVYFDGELRARGFKVFWKKYPRRKHCFLYGQCYMDDKRIAINRVLARSEVPNYVVLGTVFHEQLHAVIGADHDDAFNMAEMRFVHHATTQLWESENHGWLLKVS